jgi:hypothetical protein
MHRFSLLVPLLALLGCTDKGFTLDTGDLVDTGVPQCGRVRGTEGILLYQDDGNAIRSPVDAPDAVDNTTGVAGPLGDDRTYVAVTNGRALQSLDGGCNWDAVGNLPAGDWRLVAAGSRVYAFDAASAAGARSDDLGVSWTAFDAVEAFVGEQPVVDAADTARLRGLQARGVVTSSDGGESWSVGAALPAEATNLADADLSPGNLDVAVLAAGNGAWRTENAGTSWSPIGTDATSAVAIHPDDGAVVFATMTDADALTTIYRSADSGGTWSRLVDSTQVVLPTGPALWPVPGNTLQALSAEGPLYNENTETDGVNVYIVTGGSGTRTSFVGTFFRVHQFAFGDDRWVAAVDAVP